MIDPNDFVLVTSTKIPATSATWITGSTNNDAVSISNALPIASGQLPQLQLETDAMPFSTTQIWNPNLSVRPMGFDGVSSCHTVQILRSDEDGNFDIYVTDLMIEPVLQNSSAALWGDLVSANNPNTQLLSATLVGLRIMPPIRNPLTVNNIRLVDLLFAPGNNTSFDYTSAQPNTDTQVTSSVTSQVLHITLTGVDSVAFSDENNILGTLTNEWVATQRSAILEDLTNNGFTTYPATAVNPILMGSVEELMNWPLVEVLGV